MSACDEDVQNIIYYLEGLGCFLDAQVVPKWNWVQLSCVNLSLNYIDAKGVGLNIGTQTKI